MAETPNYNLYLPGQGEEAWDDEMNQNLVTIDATLQALADIIDGALYQINNVTYVAANARWNGSAWNRVDTGAPAVRLTLNTTNGSLEIATAAAGANPITWTTIQAFSATGLDMKTKKVYNLATPTAGTDAATKAYIDGLIAALKLSQIEIDADKNWGGKKITNVGAIDVVGNATFAGGLWAQYGQLLAPLTQDAAFRVYQDNTSKCTYSGSGQILKSVTVPSRYIVPGSVYVKFNHSGVGYTRISLNGAVVLSVPPGGVMENVKAGDVITVVVAGNGEYQGCNSLFEIYALDVPISKGRPW